MKIKKILLSFVLVFTLLACVSCKKDNDNKEEFKPTAISTVLTTYKNNQSTKVEGVVYGVVKNGFYVSDSNDAGIFVVMGDNWNANVAIGDKVQITGEFSINKTFNQIKNVKSVKKVSSNNAITLTPAELTVDQVNSIDPSQKTGSHGKIVSMVVAVESNFSGSLVLKDDQGKTVLVYDNSNSELSTYQGKRITVKVITHRYDDSAKCWIVSFAGTSADIVETPLTFNDVVAKAREHIESVVPQNIYGALSLPSGHPILSYVKYEWTVSANDYVKIEDSKVIVVLDEVDHTVTFTVTISNGTESSTIDYQITSKAIVEQDLSTILNNPPLVNMSTISTRGIVVAITRNQSTSLRSFVIQDPNTKETIVVDFTNNDDEFIKNTSDLFKSVKLGDLIKVTGQLDNGERRSIENVSGLEVKSSGNPVVHDVENAYVLSDQASYENLGNNYRDYVGQLIKVVNPYLNYSTSSTPSDTNWVRFGYDTTSGNSGFGVKGDSHIFAFLIAAQNESLGSDSWHTNYAIPFINDPNGAKQFFVTYYIYFVYYEGSTYMQFIIPSTECIEVVGAEKINLELSEAVPAYIDSAISSSLELPTEHNIAGAITWESSNETVLSSTGVVGTVSEATVVTLTAKYTFAGEEQSISFTLTVLPQEAQTVTEVLGYEEELYVKVNGIVVSYVSDGNTVESRNGVLVLDRETGKTVLLTNLTAFGGTMGNYVDQEGASIEVGDEIVAIGKYALDSASIGDGPVQEGRNFVEVYPSTVLKVVAKDVEFDYHLENAVTISSKAELQAFTDNVQYGTVIKLVGTKDNPIWIGGSSSSMPVNFKVFFTEGGKPSNAASDAKFNGTIYALKSNVVAYTLGDSWFNDLFGITDAFVAPKDSNSGVALVGEMYVAVAFRTKTYFQMCAVAGDQWNLTRTGSLEEVQTYLAKRVPGSVENGVQDFTLPTKSVYTTGEITWVSSNPSVFDVNTMTATAALVDTEVTLTATFVLAGEEQVATVKVTVLGLGEPELVQIASLLANASADSVQKTEGIVVSYHSDGNTSGNLRGIILMDPVSKDLLLVDGVQKYTPEEVTFAHGTYYASNGTALQIGDKVEIMAIYQIDGTRKSLLIGEESYINILSNGNEVSFGEAKVTVSNNEEMINFAANLQVGVLVKFVGTEENPFCFGGSSTTASKINYKFFYNKEAAKNDDVKYAVTHGSVAGTSLTFSFKGQVNVPTLGDNWWETYFGLPAAFVGPSDTVPPYTYSGTIYAVVSAVTSTYVQMSFIGVENINSTNVTPAE